MFSARDFLKVLKDFDVIMERRGEGSRSILLNLRNNKRTAFHYHNLGHEIRPDIIRIILRDLEIDFSDFMFGRAKNIKKQNPEKVLL